MSALHVLVVGVIATITLDLWQQILRLVFGIPITDWAMIGRWVGHFRDGQFVHRDIGKATPVAHERALGWLVHYVVGIGYAVVYLLLMAFVFRSPPDLPSALAFAAVSVVVTWFFMEPILGAGVMASRTPKPAVVRAQDLTSHLSLGVGLYVGQLLVRHWLGG